MLRLEAVKAMVPESRHHVQSHRRPVALQRPGPDPPHGDVLEPVLQPRGQDGRLPPASTVPALRLVSRARTLATTVARLAPDTWRRSRLPFSFRPIET